MSAAIAAILILLESTLLHGFQGIEENPHEPRLPWNVYESIRCNGPF